MRDIPRVAVEFVAGYEKFRADAYKPTPNDVWTIGFGHTRNVQPGETVSREIALNLLALDMQEARLGLYRRVHPQIIEAMPENEYAALLSFCFNCGAGDWTIFKLLDMGKSAEAQAEMMHFVHQGKTVLPGLVNRRKAEIELWNRK